MPTKLDYIVLCDIADTEPASFIEDWIDANALTSQVVPYDSNEHMQFGVYVSEAAKKASAVVLCLTNNFSPIQFAVPDFHAAVRHDPNCSLGKVFAVAIAPLKQTELTPVLNIIDAANGEERDRRRRFVEGVIKHQSPKKAKRTTKKSPEAKVGTTINQTIGRARDVVAAGRDVIQTKKHIIRTEFTPDERHITPEQASRIKRLVDDLAEMDDAAGKAIGRSYQQWWKMLNNTFEVTTYKEIPRERFEEALSFLQQAKARNLPKIRRKDNELWRNKHYQVIFGIGKKELGWSDEEIHSFATLKLGKPVASLSDIGERDLAKLARQIRAAAKKR